MTDDSLTTTPRRSARFTPSSSASGPSQNLRKRARPSTDQNTFNKYAATTTSPLRASYTRAEKRRRIEEAADPKGKGKAIAPPEPAPRANHRKRKSLSALDDDVVLKKPQVDEDEPPQPVTVGRRVKKKRKSAEVEDTTVPQNPFDIVQIARIGVSSQADEGKGDAAADDGHIDLEKVYSQHTDFFQSINSHATTIANSIHDVLFIESTTQSGDFAYPDTTTSATPTHHIAYHREPNSEAAIFDGEEEEGGGGWYWPAEEVEPAEWRGVGEPSRASSTCAVDLLTDVQPSYPRGVICSAYTGACGLFTDTDARWIPLEAFPSPLTRYTPPFRIYPPTFTIPRATLTPTVERAAA
ncbi:hypothetical protein CC1G_04049 [Coprinopsis cinerea okayama7|uniref:Uncharacterized protein n=1 Tax=Coprinopsis cinerea (strain Okayama-7 / 130 / ATCC MYA-4618 / FGSC 9003) TaxID=240176 RepID=A8NVR1_COPC7|nr:hypothetical protein CC1G_04049 [Coprinopsis cinerea okayama7\|eukprot:XP_001836736.2 hypothetical protein CC1G_04049 [Coprinopsis cinerea okayama7\